MTSKQLKIKCFPSAKEIVDEFTFNLLGEESYRQIDIRLIITINTLCQLKPEWMFICNTWSFSNWKKYGNQKWQDRGLRTVQSITGVKTGSHPKGMALDFDVYDRETGKQISAKNVRKFIFDNIDRFEFIKGIELGINWVHVDVMDDIDCPEKRSIVGAGKVIVFWPLDKSKTSKVLFKHELISFIES